MNPNQVQPVTATELDELKRLLAAAHPGPWTNTHQKTWIAGPNKKIGGEMHVADVRGWGYLTGGGHGALGLDAAIAMAIQDATGDLIVSMHAILPRLISTMEAGASTAPGVREGELADRLVPGHPDAYLNALLDYTRGFYASAIAAGMRAAHAADAVKHVESAARGLHRLALSPTMGEEKPTKHTMTLNLTDEEMVALEELARKKEPVMEAAKKLLCDICACAAESDNLDLPHVVQDCVQPLATLLRERDIMVDLHQRLIDLAGMREHTADDFIEWLNLTKEAGKALSALRSVAPSPSGAGADVLAEDHKARTRDNVIEQATEAAFSGAGACTEELAQAVASYLLARGDTEMAADLAEQYGFDPAGDEDHLRLRAEEARPPISPSDREPSTGAS